MFKTFTNLFTTFRSYLQHLYLIYEIDGPVHDIMVLSTTFTVLFTTFMVLFTTFTVLYKTFIVLITDFRSYLWLLRPDLRHLPSYFQHLGRIYNIYGLI